MSLSILYLLISGKSRKRVLFCSYIPINSFSKRFYLFLERGEGKEKERERKINVWLPLARPLLGIWPPTQACVLTGNRTGGPLVCSLCPIHWAAPARAVVSFFINHTEIFSGTWFRCSLLVASDVINTSLRPVAISILSLLTWTLKSLFIYYLSSALLPAAFCAFMLQWWVKWSQAQIAV